MKLFYKILIIYLLLIISLFIIGKFYDGSVRYPCQEQENWQNPECIPPVCYVEGSCTKDLFPQEMWKELGIPSE
jgi:hypothetical protein